ncbi:MAG: M48 family metallopeptidase [Acholeplasma sp.]|nr:M48 family metallopeptidase [Acholeplasma sp.]
MKWLIIGLVVFLFVVDSFILKLMTKKPKTIDPRTFEIYDQEAYIKWDRYQKDKVRLSLISKFVNFSMILLFLVFNLHVLIYKYAQTLTLCTICQNMYFLFFVLIIFVPINILFSYIRIFKVEEKHGFNTQTIKLFVKDTIIETILTLSLEFGVIIGLNYLLVMTDIWFLIYGVLIGNFFIVLSVLLLPLFNRLFNTFKPLEEGSLRDNITNLLNKTNVSVSKILVMNASKRTKKMNAYFTGFGSKKRIVLYDTILTGLEEDEVLAVLAHELGHAKHKDVLRMLPMSILSLSLFIVLSYYVSTFDLLSKAFGFERANFVFSLLILFEVIDIVIKVIQIPQNKFIRTMEYKADKFASIHAGKSNMINALIKLTKTNFSDLNPDPLLVTLLYDHPTTFQRIDAIETLD